MKIIVPQNVTDAMFVSSTAAADAEPEWDISTTYSAGDRVKSSTAHKIYESAVGSNIGNNPATDDGTNWTEISATNAWKAFDGKIGDAAVNDVGVSGFIQYVIDITDSFVNAIAFFNLTADQVGLYMFDEYGEMSSVGYLTIETYDLTDIYDWYSLFTTIPTDYATQVLMTGFVAVPGYRMYIGVGSGNGPTASVGEIVLGHIITLGETLEGTSLGFQSFSTKEQDAFGNWTIVPRAQSDPIEFQFSIDPTKADKTKRILRDIRDIPVVYFADEDMDPGYGAMTYGFFVDYDIPLVTQGKITIQLEVEGLT